MYRRAPDYLVGNLIISIKGERMVTASSTRVSVGPDRSRKLEVVFRVVKTQEVKYK